MGRRNCWSCPQTGHGPPTLSYRGARQRFILNPTLTQALRELGQRAQTTLFTIFAAALNTLFYRYTGKEDILLGIPIADRDRKETASDDGLPARMPRS